MVRHYLVVVTHYELLHRLDLVNFVLLLGGFRSDN